MRGLGGQRGRAGEDRRPDLGERDPKARPESPPAPPPASGITYLPLVNAAHQAELAQRVNYHAITGQPSGHSPEDIQP